MKGRQSSARQRDVIPERHVKTSGRIEQSVPGIRNCASMGSCLMAKQTARLICTSPLLIKRTRSSDVSCGNCAKEMACFLRISRLLWGRTAKTCWLMCRHQCRLSSLNERPHRAQRRMRFSASTIGSMTSVDAWHQIAEREVDVICVTGKENARRREWMSPAVRNGQVMR